MIDFKLWLEQQEFVGFIEQVVNEENTQPKLWSAKKKEILQMWQNLRPDQPIIMHPVDKNDGSTNHSSYGEDGIRITGTWPFIAGILSKLKSVLVYENPNMKLRLVFRGIDPNRLKDNRQAYVFYVNLEPRSKGRPGRKRI